MAVKTQRLRVLALNLAPDRCRCMHHDGFGRAGPHGQVVGAGAGSAFAAATEVARHRPFARGQHRVETTEMVGHRMRQAGVGGSGQHQAAPGRTLLAQPVDKRCVQRQFGRHQRHMVGDAPLETGLAQPQPQQQAPPQPGTAPQQGPDGLVQGVGGQQRAIHVHIQRAAVGSVGAGGWVHGGRAGMRAL